MYTIDLSALPEHVGYANVVNQLDYLDPGETLQIIDDCDPAVLIRALEDERPRFRHCFAVTLHRGIRRYFLWIQRRFEEGAQPREESVSRG